MSRRNQIEMSPDEVQSFLAEERTVICATNGRRGFPHLMPLWYVLRDGEVWSWTYAKSQKTRNLERDDRATLQVETGETYDQLRGVMIEARTLVLHDTAIVAALGEQIFRRYASDAEGNIGPEVVDMVHAQAPKRVALHFVPERVASWDHRKLGGAY
jgi:nitroimidazol reductase NimA-like FMN-containing flavoprotein (pyridoxamine 5'-phosphate oxidase superfamily)